MDFIFNDQFAKGLSFGVADGVGGWVTHGVDPSLFSQALMYHAARYAKDGWPGEPESEPDVDLVSNPVQGWELLPKHCLELSYQAVLRESTIQAGLFFCHRPVKSDAYG
jgi:protein phosphatase PTC7